MTKSELEKKLQQEMRGAVDNIGKETKEIFSELDFQTAVSNASEEIYQSAEMRVGELESEELDEEDEEDEDEEDEDYDFDDEDDDEEE